MTTPQPEGIGFQGRAGVVDSAWCSLSVGTYAGCWLSRLADGWKCLCCGPKSKSDSVVKEMSLPLFPVIPA